ncbi:hypothetical protein BU26DRAFT_413352 [Trematosphaeria pertusa]|uniref:Rhodopsin domain-containing protein n=1 Tax=Trematosphaeria pertusa TaxID=390896 RepID=A0A6A6J3P8_9PLEO|nr:uncharacterized protein BU26DRAFT_413352 [Trematosphaeria pertusa]KAF2257266.1 hypothetical protein BU26DRAFT_413352 [Trematosphaeria pertusa]
MPRYPLQETCLAVIYGTPLLATIFVALRIYTRRKLNLRLGWDDWLIVIPTLLSIALIGPSYKHVKMWHVGIHIWQVPPNEIEPDYDEYYAVLLAFNLLNIPILPLVKASIILLLLRAGSVIEWLKKVLYGILIFTIGSAFVPWCLYIFICPPLTGNTYKPRTFGGLKCMNRQRYGEMLIWVTCANLLTDLLIFPIPFIIVRRMMSARLRSRMVVLAVFTSSLAVTGIGAAKIYLSYRDRLYTLFKPDWTYPIDYCINHVENNVAIIVANIPILRGLVTRWVFNFKTKATPIEREFRNDWQWSTSNSSTFTRVARKNKFAQKIMPCIDDDFSSSLARSRDIRDPNLPPRVITDFRKNRSFKARSRKQSRRNSLDRYETADCCEKGDALETVRSIGSLGSAPTLVESKELDWRLSEASLMSSPRRVSSPTLSPISPLSPCVLRGIEDEDEILRYP